MLHRLKALLQDRGSGEQAGLHRGAEELRLAAAALLAEAARLDGMLDSVERATILQLLRERFDLAAGEAEELVALAEQRVEQSSQYFGFVHVINRRFTLEERVGLIEMLWEVVYADGAVHELEASLMRRLAGLLHVPDPDSGAARKRVLARRGPEGSGTGG